MDSNTSLWEILLTWLMLGGMLGGAIASNAEGAEVLLEWPGPS